MIAVETSHGVPARIVIAADGVDELGRLAVLVVVDVRAVLVEVDLHLGIEGLNRCPGVRANLVVAEAVKVEQIEFRELRGVGGDQSGASAVIEKEGLDGLARRGGLRRERQSRAQEKRKGGGAYCNSCAPAYRGDRWVMVRKIHDDGLGVVDSLQPVPSS